MWSRSRSSARSPSFLVAVTTWSMVPRLGCSDQTLASIKQRSIKQERLSRSMPKETIPKDIWVTAQDGLKLHVRQWGPQAASALSVVCLPGLARTVADFDPLATAIA